jgi:hypothetical protein
MTDEFEALITADGYFRIATFSRKSAMKESLLLMFRYGFHRWGAYILPIAGEGIYPSYHRGRLKILSGFDDWCGYDWFGLDEKTDQFLRKFYDKHCAVRAYKLVNGSRCRGRYAMSEIEKAFRALAEGGSELMPLDD